MSSLAGWIMAEQTCGLDRERRKPAALRESGLSRDPLDGSQQRSRVRAGPHQPGYRRNIVRRRVHHTGSQLIHSGRQNVKPDTGVDELLALLPVNAAYRPVPDEHGHRRKCQLIGVKLT
jgi:hypothetical protein